MYEFASFHISLTVGMIRLQEAWSPHRVALAEAVKTTLLERGLNLKKALVEVSCNMVDETIS